MRKINLAQKISGEFHLLIHDFRTLDYERHYQYFRMDYIRFDNLLSLIQPFLQHKSTHRIPISPAERLAITLRYLATGDSQQTIAISFRIGKSTVNKIIFETCEILWNTL